MTETSALWLSELELYLLADAEIAMPGLEVRLNEESSRSPWEVTYRVIVVRTTDEDEEGDWKDTWWEGFYRVGIADEVVLSVEAKPLARVYAALETVTKIVYKPWDGAEE